MGETRNWGKSRFAILKYCNAYKVFDVYFDLYINKLRQKNALRTADAKFLYHASLQWEVKHLKAMNSLNFI
jgi:hypothetical protein